VTGFTGATGVRAGGLHSLALKADGSVWAWGRNYSGQLGDGSTRDRNSPGQVSGLTGVTAIASGPDGSHNLALKTDGTVWAWGENGNGQLGDGSTTDRTTPIQVGGLTGVTAIAAGGAHSLALTGDGSVWAWGRNTDGQLGDGTTTERRTPVQVGSLGGVAAIAVGGYHSLASKSDGTLWAWGNNLYGSLGDGSDHQADFSCAGSVG